ncbi:MAG TPA: metal ABC transporter substrate-binding protein [Longimicrobiales bacterium]|nr:metal ABC transporter substrate-binding protein [Longimicrobiales bacterium]
MRAPILLVLLAPGIASCGGADAPPPAADRPTVVASIHPIAALVRVLVGERADVRVLLPPGAHADTFEPRPRMAEAVEGAALIIKVGGGLDEWVGTPGAGGRLLVLTEGMTLRGGDGQGGSGNPHVWLDPLLVRDRMLPRLAEALAARDAQAATEIRARAAALADSLTALDAEIGRILADAPTRRFIAAHPAWWYFADRYGLEQVGVLHPSPGEEIGTRELARLVREARSRGVRAVIAEPQLGRAGVAALADELGVRVEVADPIGGAGVEGRDGYLDLMRWNARAFARALGGA